MCLGLISISINVFLEMCISQDYKLNENIGNKKPLFTAYLLIYYIVNINYYTCDIVTVLRGKKSSIRNIVVVI